MKFTHSLAMIFLCLTFGVNAQENSTETTPNKPRIIALAPHIVEMLFDIGAGEQIIAATEYANYPLAAQEIPRIGNSLRIQLERVIELQPDLIIAWQSGNPSDDLARIKQLGFNVVYSQPNTFDDVAKELRLFGKLSGHSEQAEQVASKFLADLAKIKQQYGQKKPLTGFYEVWSRPLTTIAKGSWPQQFLDICSISNPFYQSDARYPQVNIEQILQTHAEIIIQPLSENQADKEGYTWQKWPILPAVKHQQIIKLDADVVHRMTTRSLNALSDLCQQTDGSRQYYQQG
ncbi:cobalamin-binding protein [Colwellia sp. M166]|uniref:cobalamin-binding protein n=1 Tax=Colwellia sp. M166 TaxID=2583805 RepID=UPI00211E3A8C|nr:cobalamin-binding protein [Colwellia sp. M166]|tara:strand:+ start:4743 stop:5609 length:867 start_codon:yes stop_codon:yes gene_type:complete